MDGEVDAKRQLPQELRDRRDIRSGGLPEQALDAVIAQQTIPRQGTAADLVGAVLLLTSDDASL